LAKLRSKIRDRLSHRLLLIFFRSRLPQFEPCSGRRRINPEPCVTAYRMVITVAELIALAAIAEPDTPWSLTVALEVLALIQTFRSEWTWAFSCDRTLSHPAYASADGEKCRRTLIIGHNLSGGLRRAGKG